MKKLIEKAEKFNPWSPLLGLTRTLLAITTLLTLLTNNADTVLYLGDMTESVFFLDRINFFYLFGNHLSIAKVLAIIVLLWVCSGYAPRYSCIFHWWIAWSFKYVYPYFNGGDTIASIITLFLIPICLFDYRKNHWNREPVSKNSNIIHIICSVVFFYLKVQIAYIYFDAFISKIYLPEWIQGTAVWYYAHHSVFGFIDFPLMKMLLSNALICFLLTYSVLVLEFLLGISIFQKGQRRYKEILFIIGVLFHMIISVQIGIISFGITMFAALILLLIPLDRHDYLELRWKQITFLVKNISRPWKLSKDG